MNISYDDPFNLKDPRSFRASLGFLLPNYDAQLIEKFKKLHYEWRSLPAAKALKGDFTYRNEASLAFGMQRFLPTCLNYVMRNARRLKKVMAERTGTIEVVQGKTISYYLMMEKQKDFYLTSKGQPELKDEGKFTTMYYKKHE